MGTRGVSPELCTRPHVCLCEFVRGQTTLLFCEVEKLVAKASFSGPAPQAGAALLRITNGKYFVNSEALYKCKPSLQHHQHYSAEAKLLTYAWRGPGSAPVATVTTASTYRRPHVAVHRAALLTPEPLPVSFSLLLIRLTTGPPWWI